MFKTRQNFLKGFTVVELLIVLTIMVILTIIVLTGLSVARARARDAERKQEIDGLRKAVEYYFIDHGKYPAEDSGCDIETEYNTQSGNFYNEMRTTYVPIAPNDPLYPREYESGKKYAYHYRTLSGGTEYKIRVRLEETGLDYEAYSDGGSAIPY